MSSSSFKCGQNVGTDSCRRRRDAAGGVLVGLVWIQIDWDLCKFVYRFLLTSSAPIRVGDTGPVFVHALERVFQRERDGLLGRDSHSLDQFIDEMERQGFRVWRWGGPTAIRKHFVLDAVPKLIVRDLELIAEDRRPHGGRVGRSVDRLRDAGTQDIAGRNDEFIRAVVLHGFACRAVDDLPAFEDAEVVVSLAVGRRMLTQGVR